MNINNDLSLEEINLSQKRMYFEDPTNHKTHFLTNVLIYSSVYYPHTDQLVAEIATKVSENYPQIWLNALKHLYSCIEREIIYGPSSSYSPPGDIQ